MKIKKTIIIILIIAVIIVPVFAFAHSGRTDSSGGHRDIFAGEYHYHHGYSAHQHSDGVCPYEDDSDLTAAENNISFAEWSNTKKAKETTAEYNDRYEAGYDDGYLIGYSEGFDAGNYDDGYDYGYYEGYDEGFEDGKPVVPEWCFAVIGVESLIIFILICKIRENRND